MRVATNSIYSLGVFNMNNRQVDLFKLQNQLSTGRRVLSPEDDPVAASRTLDLKQAQDVNEQFIANVKDAASSMALSEGILQQVTHVIQDIQQAAVQSGNPALTSAEKKMIEADIRGKYHELMALANSTDGNGQYLFSGYKGDTKPFNEQAYGDVRYDGDQGNRAIQISAARQIPVSDSGSDIFIRIRTGNGRFSTATLPNSAGVSNLGTGVVSPGVVTDPIKWANPQNNANYRIQFHTVTDPADASKTISRYDVIDNDTGSANYNRSLLDGYNYTINLPAGGRTDTAGTPNAYPRVYTAGADIVLAQQAGEASPLYGAGWDFGAKLAVQGIPKEGDRFSIVASTNQDIFTTLGDYAKALTGYADNEVSAADFQNKLNSALSNLNNALGNVLTVQANIGSRLKEGDSVLNTNEDVNIQLQTSISRLSDLDFVQAISDFQMTQTYLEAARQSFSSVQNLSLFRYLS